jgi:hypothetical protein
MRTRKAKHALHGSAWPRKRGRATIDNQLSEHCKSSGPTHTQSMFASKPNAPFRPIYPAYKVGHTASQNESLYVHMPRDEHERSYQHRGSDRPSCKRIKLGCPRV